MPWAIAAFAWTIRIFIIMSQYSLTIIDPHTRDLALSITGFKDDSPFNNLKKYSYFSMLLVQKGSGTVVRDGAVYSFHGGSLLCFAIYQPFMVQANGELEGTLIHFHPSFFCLFKHRNEVSCNGVLFNNLYDTPVVQLGADDTRSLSVVADHMSDELRLHDAPDQDLLLSYLKVFLIHASRAKMEKRSGEKKQIAGQTPVTRRN